MGAGRAARAHAVAVAVAVADAAAASADTEYSVVVAAGVGGRRNWHYSGTAACSARRWEVESSSHEPGVGRLIVDGGGYWDWSSSGPGCYHGGRRGPAGSSEGQCRLRRHKQ